MEERITRESLHLCICAQILTYSKATTTISRPSGPIVFTLCSMIFWTLQFSLSSTTAGYPSGCLPQMTRTRKSKSRSIHISRLRVPVRRHSTAVSMPCCHRDHAGSNLLSGSRRLITYRRIPDSDVPPEAIKEQRAKDQGVNADDLNPFRKSYFKGFKLDDE
jgi:hypothetical protein